jgi:CRP-like cAMP-binding protein
MGEGCPPPANPLARKLGHFIPITAEDERVLDGLERSQESIEAHQDIIEEGQVPRSVFLVKAGLACRYRILPDGRRQIMTFLLPGDLNDLHVFLLKEMDHSIAAITPVRIATIARESVMELAIDRPRITAGLWWSSLQEEALLRERIVALGRRDAAGRVAYLLCEMLWRHQAVGMAEGHSFELPLTQVELADTLGMTAVHINRVLQGLRRKGLIVLKNRTVVLNNLTALQALAEFTRSYLHLGGAPDTAKRYLTQLENDRANGLGRRPEQGPAGLNSR